MSTVRVSWGRKLHILDFDIENRPLSYGGQDFTFSDVTAIACCTVGRPRSMQAWVLGETSTADMLSGFLERFREADIVTGHNVVRHDLPILNGALLELGLPGLHPKLVSDTYRDLRRRQGVSASQESLAAMLGITSPKIGMSQKDWRMANRLLPEGLVKTRARVVGDVVQHQALRKELLRLGWLRAPRMWRP